MQQNLINCDVVYKLQIIIILSLLNLYKKANLNNMISLKFGTSIMLKKLRNQKK